MDHEDYYKVLRKEGTHISNKRNADGSVTGLQFSDEDNSLEGPVTLIKTGIEDEIEARVDKRIEESVEYAIAVETLANLIVVGITTLTPLVIEAGKFAIDKVAPILKRKYEEHKTKRIAKKEEKKALAEQRQVEPKLKLTKEQHEMLVYILNNHEIVDDAENIEQPVLLENQKANTILDTPNKNTILDLTNNLGVQYEAEEVHRSSKE